MAVKIRLKRFGKIRAPYYRIVVADSREGWCRAYNKLVSLLFGGVIQVLVTIAAVICFGLYTAIKAAYLSTVYATLILERNLFGLEIDPRAAQMAGFALLMKARADDRTILQNPPRVNVVALRPSGREIAGEPETFCSGVNATQSTSRSITCW